jgi:uncharacterized protein
MHTSNYILAFLIAWLALAARAGETPGFDCAKASTSIELAICSDSGLSSTDAHMSETYRAVYESLDKDLQPLLRDNQRRWLRTRDEACEGRYGRDCLLPVYSNRMWELGRIKHFAEERKRDPARPVFVPMQLADGEVEQLERLLSETRHALPDGYLKLDRGKFLMPITNTGRVAQGLYYADLRNREIVRVVGGLAGVVRFASKDGYTWILISSLSLHRGVMSTEFAAVHIDAGARVKPTTQFLISVVEDGETGGCGRGKSINITTAGKIHGYETRDINGDGFEDVIFRLSETDCATGRTTSKEKRFIYERGSFSEGNQQPHR